MVQIQNINKVCTPFILFFSGLWNKATASVHVQVWPLTWPLTLLCAVCNLTVLFCSKCCESATQSCFVYCVGVRFLENGFELFNSKLQSQYSLQLPDHNFLVLIEQLNKWILVTFHIPSLKSMKRTFLIFLPHYLYINHFGMKCYSGDTI